MRFRDWAIGSQRDAIKKVDQGGLDTPVHIVGRSVSVDDSKAIGVLLGHFHEALGDRRVIVCASSANRIVGPAITFDQSLSHAFGVDRDQEREIGS